MSTPVRFSVVVTNYNYRAFVCEAVDGALAQTREALQVIVVDDGSTDGSPELLTERYGNDPRVTLLLGENGGQLAAFRRGLARVQGEVVCFLDADDLWQSHYLAGLGEVFDARNDVDFVFSDLELFGQQHAHMRYADRALDLGYTAVSTYLLMHWYGAPTSALALRTAWARRTLDLPDQLDLSWRLSADNCLVFGTSVLGGRKYYQPTGAVRYRIHGNNGWWGNRTPANEYLNRFRSRCLIEHYARTIGLDARCVDFAKQEFKTKPLPTWREARRYAALVRQRRGSWWRGLERALAILWSAWRRRRELPVEYKGLA
ncbi:glycosyltransferase family 2 protein [Dyella sp.]|jgi:glycosyltransferase involved in cell wall biosynthesis|uniref:glycosyltransferase family 2 protein n=1 Tax=Dyella sp. TaxID=1869338 RepID=UPI002D79432C|nr:glycosyltransferase [Dyella sp.]HET6430611.1 glycosyltransferase [Dyella sp.]